MVVIVGFCCCCILDCSSIVLLLCSVRQLLWSSNVWSANLRFAIDYLYWFFMSGSCVLFLTGPDEFKFQVPSLKFKIKFKLKFLLFLYQDTAWIYPVPYTLFRIFWSCFSFYLVCSCSCSWFLLLLSPVFGIRLYLGISSWSRLLPRRSWHSSD